MQVRDMMSTQIISIAPDENAAVAARLLRHYNIGMLPVCGSDRRLHGVITDRDIVLRCIAANADPHSTQVRDIMSDHVIAISPETDATRAAVLMGQEQIRRLPVCERGKLVGMLSLADLAQKYSAEASDALCCISQGIRKK